MTCTCHHGGYHEPGNPPKENTMSKTFRIQYGSHADPIAHGESFHKRRKDAERVRRWWVDTRSPENVPGDRWAVIHQERG